MCETIRLSDGSAMIVCGVRRGHRHCAYPDCRAAATVECDHAVDDVVGKTCDRATCRAHAKPIAKNVDWCWLCARAEAKRGNSPRLAL